MLISAGGYDAEGPFDTVESGESDAMAYGRYYNLGEIVLMADGSFRIRICRGGLRRGLS